ncbi:MAG: WD40/YVTN/BNR-like repeat-containing protein [Planctomycetota bacterium]
MTRRASHLVLLLLLTALALLTSDVADVLAQPRRDRNSKNKKPPADWVATGLSGGGSMFCAAISPVDPDLRMIHCDMSGAYLSDDGGANWNMIPVAQLGGCTTCQPAFHPKKKDVIYSASGYAARLHISEDGGKTWKRIGNLPDMRLRGEIAIDPAHPDDMLVGADRNVFRSLDGGKQWVQCDSVSGQAVNFAFADEPKKRGGGNEHWWFAATDEGLWRSPDRGQKWYVVGTMLPRQGTGIRSMSAATDEKRKVSRVYVAMPAKVENGEYSGGIFVSEDGGESWTSCMRGGIAMETTAFDRWSHGSISDYHHVRTTPADPERVWAWNANTGIPPPHHATAWRSDDSGKTWRATFFPDPRYPGCNLEPDFIVAGVKQYYQSVPYAFTVCATDPDIVMFCDDMKCHLTDDGGKTWRNAHSRAGKKPGTFECTGLVVTSTWHYCIDPHDANRHYICYTDIGFARSLDAGETWCWWGSGERAPWANTCYELAFDPDVPGKMWGAFSGVHDIPNGNIIEGRHRSTGPGGVCASTDFADSWAKSNTGLPDAPCTSVIVDPSSKRGSRTLFAGMFGEGVYISEDDGKSWRALPAQPGHAENRRVERLELHGDGTLFCLITADLQKDKTGSLGAGLWRSPDRGTTWRRVNESQPLVWPKDFHVSASDSTHIFIAAADGNRLQQGGVHVTENDGKSWKLLVRKGPEHFGVFESPHAAHKGWLWTTLCEGSPGPGLWLSKDGGRTWASFDTLPFTNIQRLTFDPQDPKVMYATTFGGSVFKGIVEPR